MELKELYIELCSNPSFYNNYHSIGKGASGKIFAFIGTNCRALLTKKGNEYKGFGASFKVIKNVEGIKRSEWIQSPTRANQEKQKQHTVNMRKSEFFRVVDDAYQLTSRGIVFGKMLDNDALSDEDKKLLCILLILCGYFDDKPNYIINRVKYVYDMWRSAGYKDSEIKNIIKDFICYSNCDSFKKSDIIKYEYLYLDSFFEPYNDINFLEIYKNSSNEEKNKLADYITYNLLHNCEDMSNKCLVSYKYRNGGNYIPGTLIDNAILLYVVNSLVDRQFNGFDEFIDVLINAYKDLYNINESELRKFIYDTDKNRSVFQVIYCKLTNSPMPIVEISNTLSIEEIDSIGQIDSTDEEGQKQLIQVTGSLKKIAKLNSDYKCVLQDCEMCTYFTSKETHQNYLEIHHLIPREFSNDFDTSIEILENYIVLCPKCHRKIHLAEDNERKHMINILFNNRVNLLNAKGINIELEQLYKYYNIES